MKTQRFLVSAFALLLVGATAWADGDDPPGRAARLSYISGTVSFQPGSVEDWVPATLNRPMTTGDRLWTEAGSRAEMHFGSAAVRMNGRTNLTVLNLDDRTAQFQVSVGTVNVRLRRLADDETFEIDTPQMAFSLLRPGEYRVEVNEQGDATIAGVRGGEAEANAGSQAITVHPREQLRVMLDNAGGADQPVLDTRSMPATDPFDNFCEDRDRREDMSVSAQHVSPSRAIKISTTQAYGGKIRNTAGSGRLRLFPWDGLLTITGIGPGSHPGDGLGWTTPLGVTLRFTTDDGFLLERAGRGCRDRWFPVPCMRPPWWLGSVGAASVWESPSVVDPPSVGSPWGLAKSGCPPITTAPLILSASTSPTP